MKQMELQQQAMQLAQMQLANDRAIAQQKLEFEAQQPLQTVANIEMQIDLVKKTSAKRRWRAKPN